MSKTYKNPLMVHVCDALGLRDVPEILFLEYEDGECYANLYNLKKSSKNSPYKTKRIQLDDLISLFIEFLRSGDMPYPDTVGTDRKSLYDSITHREVKQMRVVLPSCFLQIEYEDENQNLDFSFLATDKIRECFRVVEPEETD